MPRPKKQSPSAGSQGARSSEVSGGQASYILGRLLKERRISQVDVNRYISEMGREIGELERRGTMPSSFRYDKSMRKQWEHAASEGREEQLRIETGTPK